MKRVVLAWAMVFAACSAPAAVRADNYTGTWSVSPASKSGEVQLEVRYVRTSGSGTEEWDESHGVPLSDLRGLSGADLNSNGQAKSFSIVQDAGTFHATGTFASGSGGGTWTFVPSSTFSEGLRKRGIGAPDEKQQFQLAMAGFKLSTLDSLLSSGFERPSIGDLVAMGEHGVNDQYILAMKNVPLKPKSVSELIRMRDHGVGTEFAAEMLRRAPQLTAEDLIELRDHGVSTQYMKALADNGYGNVAPSQAERMRDHGVSTSYLQGLRAMGYHPSVDDLVRLADHGVSISFIERMRSHGYSRLSVDDLIRLRDHGF